MTDEKDNGIARRRFDGVLNAAELAGARATGATGRASSSRAKGSATSCRHS